MPKLPLKEKFEKIADLVWYCLKNFPETRENDRTLILKVWELQGFRLPQKLINFFYKVASPSTILRCRRAIHNEGLFLPDSEKVARRTLFGMEHREMFRGLKSRRGNAEAT